MTKQINDDGETAYGLIGTCCSAEEAEENARVFIREAVANAKKNQDGVSGRFHKNFLMFLEMATNTLDDKRLPASDWNAVAAGQGQLLSAYDRLKNLDPDTLYSITNYSLAVHYTAWLYWEKRRCSWMQAEAAKSRTQWHGPVRERATGIHASNPKLSASAATDFIIKNWDKPEDLTLPGRGQVYDFVRLVFNEMNENSYPVS